MDFGEALRAMKNGAKVTRKGWNGAGQYVYYVPRNSYAAVTDVAKEEFGAMVPYRAYMALKTAQGDVMAGWSPTGSDCLEEDWIVVDFKGIT